MVKFKAYKKDSGLKKCILLSFGICALWGIISLAQDLQHQVSVINIEVPVRVFKGDQFVDTLSINDFEVYEDGRPQKIETIYLVKRTNVQKKEGSVRATLKPDVKRRHFVLVFEMDNYLLELNNVLDYFFTQVLAPEDTVWVVMPEDSIQLKKDALTKMPKAKISDQLKARLKKAIRRRAQILYSLIGDLGYLAGSMDAAVAKLAAIDIAQQIADLKTLSESQLSEFAKALKP